MNNVKIIETYYIQARRQSTKIYNTHHQEVAVRYILYMKRSVWFVPIWFVFIIRGERVGGLFFFFFVLKWAGLLPGIKIQYRAIKKSLCTCWLQYRTQHTFFLPHYFAQSDCLAADRQGQGDTSLTLTPSVIPNSNNVIMASDWNCLKYFCFLYCNHQVHRDFFITLYMSYLVGLCCFVFLYIFVSCYMIHTRLPSFVTKLLCSGTW
jgi:hypothetical protein